jgi:Protein of unknown function (DUF1460)
MKKQIYLIWFFASLALLLGGGMGEYPQPSRPLQENPQDSLLFIEKQLLAAKDSNLIARTMTIARSFLGAPYVHGCLDCAKKETLIVNLREMDCWTFVENSLAIALTQDDSYNFYRTFLQQLRYWGGHVDGYGSRIHYFTGWLLQAEKCGIIEDLSASMGGVPYTKKVGYITARPAKYPKINDEKAFLELKRAEKRINAHKWFFIPQDRIAAMEHLIQEGDLICLTAAKADLDIAHQGFAVKKNGRVYLMHASSLAKKVIIDRQPLAQYVITQRGQTGIMVARLKQ